MVKAFMGWDESFVKSTADIRNETFMGQVFVILKTFSSQIHVESISHYAHMQLAVRWLHQLVECSFSTLNCSANVVN